jgi:SanA protein
MKNILGKVFALFLITTVLIILWSSYIAHSGSHAIYETLESVPAKRAALVLGTAKYKVGGGKNYFYTYRMRAAVALWKAGKVNAIVVSGDNGTKYYDETTKMFKDLVKAGVPAKYITKDFAGFRTLDSVVRAKEVFGLDDYIIISQKFHLERALYIAKVKEQKAIGYVAKDIPNTPTAFKMQLREYLARAKAFLDLYILNTEPKFLGKKEAVRYK